MCYDVLSTILDIFKMVMMTVLIIMRSMIVMMTVIKMVKMRIVILSLLIMQGVRVIWRALPLRMMKMMKRGKKKKAMR